MKNLEEKARQLRNQKAKEWRNNNKDKVKEINHRYWMWERRKTFKRYTNIYN